MRNPKLILFLAFLALGLLLASACSRQSAESIAKSSNVQDTQETAQNEIPSTKTNVKDTEAAQQQQTQPAEAPQETQPQQPAQPIQQAPETKEFKITAKQFEFDPATIEVNRGDKVRLIVTSIDVPHGISIPEYGINEKLSVGKPVTIEFTADKQGTFTAFCSVFCGAGHGSMKGKLIVH